MQTTLRTIVDRYDAYSRRKISTEISEHEDMFAFGHESNGAMEHYMKVGSSAIDVIAKAMLAVGKTSVSKILDLPCGGGRVMRHLAAFLPEASLYVGDVNKSKVLAVVQQFGAHEVDPSIDFSSRPDPIFDVIWVGSLFTHLNNWLFKQALQWYLDSLAPDGILVMTTHGRRHENMQNGGQEFVPAERWKDASASLSKTGFGFVPYNIANANDPLEIGTTVNSPSWMMHLIESDLSVRVVSFQEAGWVDAQDVVVIQKRSV